MPAVSSWRQCKRPTVLEGGKAVKSKHISCGSFGVCVILLWVGSALAEPNTPSLTTPLPDDLVDPLYPSLEGLAPGSEEAQQCQRQAAQELGLPVEVRTRNTGIVLRLIPAGTFTMGSPASEPGRESDEGPQYQVTLTKAFYCGKFEVTQGQWQQVMGVNPSYFQNAGADAPVEHVSWDDCQAFLTKLCAIEGVPEGTYRLLTEAEWEYACRAGTQTALYNGDLVIVGLNNAPALDPIAWYGGNSGVEYPGGQSAGTHPIGRKMANAYGLHDMLGNVWEWCQDYYADPYPSSPQVDPEGGLFNPFALNARVLRGGSWRYDPLFCRSAGRNWNWPEYCDCDVGLRLARITPSYP
jgi:formylglycine-generating enzyme required for sulfatase activity